MIRRLVPMPPKPASSHEEPVFLEQEEPVISHQHRARTRRWNRVPYPYTFKWDGAWLTILFLAAGGFAYPPLWLFAGFLTLLRCVVWICFRFPLTSWFFIGVIEGLFSGSRRRW